MIQQHCRQLLKRLQALPAELVNPALQVIQHRALVVVAPKSVQALLEKVGLEDFSVEGEQLVEFPPFAGRQIHPAAQQ